MPASKAHQRSYTIQIRALTPATSQQQHQQSTNPSLSSSAKPRSSHTPSKSTPNAIAIMTAGVETFPTLAAAATLAADPDNLPRHNRELTLRRYLLLQEEHEIIRHHLDELSTCSSPATTTTTSPIASPTRAFGGHGKQHHCRSSSGTRRASCDAPTTRPAMRSRTSGRGARGIGIITGADKMVSMEGEPVMNAAAMAEMASEEARLFTINEGIKRSLTELLNCETTRSDQSFRQWIMSRLMEVEKELRVGRRRRSCPTDY